MFKHKLEIEDWNENANLQIKDKKDEKHACYNNLRVFSMLVKINVVFLANKKYSNVL